MLTDTSKIKTLAAQMARSKSGTKYEKDMFRKPRAKREVLAPMSWRVWPWRATERNGQGSTDPGYRAMAFEIINVVLHE